MIKSSKTAWFFITNLGRVGPGPSQKPYRGPVHFLNGSYFFPKPIIWDCIFTQIISFFELTTRPSPWTTQLTKKRNEWMKKRGFHLVKPAPKHVFYWPTSVEEEKPIVARPKGIKNPLHETFLATSCLLLTYIITNVI